MSFNWNATGGAAARSDSFTGLDNRFSSNLRALFMAAPEDIRPGLGVMSAYRSPATQAQIITNNLSKYGLSKHREAWLRDVSTLGPEAAGAKWRPTFRAAGLTRMIGMPGGSFHQKGMAVDLTYADARARKWVHDNAARFGLYFPMAHEPWHIELAGSRNEAPGVGTPSTMRVANASSTPNTNTILSAQASTPAPLMATGFEAKKSGDPAPGTAASLPAFTSIPAPPTRIFAPVPITFYNTMPDSFSTQLV